MSAKFYAGLQHVGCPHCYCYYRFSIAKSIMVLVDQKLGLRNEISNSTFFVCIAQLLCFHLLYSGNLQSPLLLRQILWNHKTCTFHRMCEHAFSRIPVCSLELLHELSCEGSLRSIFQNYVVLRCSLWLFRSWCKSFFPDPAKLAPKRGQGG